MVGTLGGNGQQQLQALLVGLGLHVFYDLAQESCRIDVIHFEPGRSSLHLRQAQDIFDQPAEPLRFAHDHVVALAERFRILQHAFAERLGIGADVG